VVLEGPEQRHGGGTARSRSPRRAPLAAAILSLNPGTREGQGWTPTPLGSGFARTPLLEQGLKGPVNVHPVLSLRVPFADNARCGSPASR
jgi:hypothetical protein